MGGRRRSFGPAPALAHPRTRDPTDPPQRARPTPATRVLGRAPGPPQRAPGQPPAWTRHAPPSPADALRAPQRAARPGPARPPAAPRPEPARGSGPPRPKTPQTPPRPPCPTPTPRIGPPPAPEPVQAPRRPGPAPVAAPGLPLGLVDVPRRVPVARQGPPRRGPRPPRVNLPARRTSPQPGPPPRPSKGRKTTTDSGQDPHLRPRSWGNDLPTHRKPPTPMAVVPTLVDPRTEGHESPGAPRARVTRRKLQREPKESVSYHTTTVEKSVGRGRTWTCPAAPTSRWSAISYSTPCSTTSLTVGSEASPSDSFPPSRPPHPSTLHVGRRVGT